MPKTEEPDFFRIDRDRLDWEWMRQPELYYQHAEKLAAARMAAEQAKTETDLVYAEMDAKIRDRPEKYGILKVTEAAVRAAILVADKYQAAVKAHLEAKYNVDILQAAVTTLDHRKRALENLVDLQGRNYFATPIAKSHSAATAEAMTDAQKRRARKAQENDDDDG